MLRINDEGKKWSNMSNKQQKSIREVPHKNRAVKEKTVCGKEKKNRYLES